MAMEPLHGAGTNFWTRFLAATRAQNAASAAAIASERLVESVLVAAQRERFAAAGVSIECLPREVLARVLYSVRVDAKTMMITTSQVS